MNITDDEAAEVLWASSEQGKAAVRAAHEKAAALGLVNEQDGLAWADIGAIVYAACLAAGWDAEPMEDAGPAPACLHSWAILAAQPHIPAVMFSKPVPHTIALIRCTACSEPDSRMLVGEWTLEDLQRQQP